MIGHGGLLRVFSFTPPIKGSGMSNSLVEFTLTVANDFADFSVNSQLILMHFPSTIFWSWGDYPENFIEKYCIKVSQFNI